MISSSIVSLVPREKKEAETKEEEEEEVVEFGDASGEYRDRDIEADRGSD